MMDKNFLENFVHHLFPSAIRAEFEPLSDQQLLQRYLEHRDEFAFGEVVRRHGTMIWAVCRRILRQRQDAEDVYQITFLKLVRRAVFVQRCESVEAWLHTVARNAALNAKLKRDRERAREEKTAQMHEEGYVDARNTGHTGAILDEEIAHLPERFRRPLVLCYLEGLTHEEAAQQLNISARCLKRRLAEGRQRLHKRLSQERAPCEKGCCGGQEPLQEFCT